MRRIFYSVRSHCWLGDRKSIRPVKSWLLVRSWWRFDWSFPCVIATVVNTTSIILNFNKTAANGDSPEKMAVKTERERWGLVLSCYPRRSRSAISVDIVFTLVYVCLYVCMYVSALERKRLIGMTWNSEP